MRISVLAAALMLGTSIASASPLNKYTTGLGYLPALPGGVPDRDFAIGRLSKNPLSIAYTAQDILPNFSSVSISASQFSLSPVGTLTLQVNTTAYPGVFLKGSLVKIRSASSFAANANAAATISGVVADDTYNPSIGTLNLVNVAKYTFTGNVSYTDWTLVGHTPSLGNKSNATPSGANAGTLAFYARTTPQTLADWDWTNIVGGLSFYPGDLDGETAVISVTQGLFQAGNAFVNTPFTLGAGMFGPIGGLQPYKVSFCEILFRPLLNSTFTTKVVGAVQANASNDLTLCKITLDSVPADLAASPASYSVYLPNNPSKLLFVNCNSVSGNTITLENQYPQDQTSYSGYPPRSTPILSSIDDGETVVLYKYAGSAQIVTGMCAGFSYNYVEVPLDFFYIVKAHATEQATVFGNVVVLTGHAPGTYHADFVQDYGFTTGPGFLYSNNIMLARPKPGLNVNGNPRDIFQVPANYAIAAPREIVNNIFEVQGLSTYAFFFEQSPVYTVTAIAPDPATGQIRVFFNAIGNPGAMKPNDPYFVGGFDDAIGINSTRARCGTAYAAQEISAISQSFIVQTSDQALVGATSVTLNSTVGIVKGMTLSFGGVTITVTDVDSTTMYFTPQTVSVVNAGSNLSFPPSITLAGSDASKLSAYTAVGLVTATVNADAASGTDIISIADTSNLRVGMVITPYVNPDSKVNTMYVGRYFIKAFVPGGIQVSRKLVGVVKSGAVLSFRAQIRPCKTALTAVHDNYLATATTRYNVSPVTTAGTVPQGLYWPYVVNTGGAYGLMESSATPQQTAFSWYNNKRILTDGNGAFTALDPAGEIPFTMIASDTYQALGYSDENQYRGITRWNPPCAAPTSIQAKVVSGAATKATITYVADTASLGETFSLDGGLSWSDPSATGGLISSGATIVRGAASTIMLRSMNAYDDFAVPRNPGTASNPVTLTV